MEPRAFRNGDSRRADGPTRSCRRPPDPHLMARARALVLMAASLLSASCTPHLFGELEDRAAQDIAQGISRDVLYAGDSSRSCPCSSTPCRVQCEMKGRLDGSGFTDGCSPGSGTFA